MIKDGSLGVNFDDGRFKLSPTRPPPNPFPSNPVFDKGSDEWSEGTNPNKDSFERLRTPLGESGEHIEDERRSQQGPKLPKLRTDNMNEEENFGSIDKET